MSVEAHCIFKGNNYLHLIKHNIFLLKKSAPFSYPNDNKMNIIGGWHVKEDG